jgi:hypothetical protein
MSATEALENITKMIVIANSHTLEILIRDDPFLCAYEA